MKISFVTGNASKLREAEMILGYAIEKNDIDINEIQAIEVSCVAEDKARRAYEILKKPLIVEDTGLYITEYNNFPGALVKWMVKYMGINEMSKIFCGKSAKAECCVCYYDGKNMEIFKGQVNGKIAPKPVGESNFGWDPIFIPEGCEKSFAQMTTEEKNEISHRGKAFRLAKEFLNSVEE